MSRHIAAANEIVRYVKPLLATASDPSNRIDPRKVAKMLWDFVTTDLVPGLKQTAAEEEHERLRALEGRAHLQSLSASPEENEKLLEELEAASKAGSKEAPSMAGSKADSKIGSKEHSKRGSKVSSKDATELTEEKAGSEAGSKEAPSMACSRVGSKDAVAGLKTGSKEAPSRTGSKVSSKEASSKIGSKEPAATSELTQGATVADQTPLTVAPQDAIVGALAPEEESSGGISRAEALREETAIVSLTFNWLRHNVSQMLINAARADDLDDRAHFLLYHVVCKFVAEYLSSTKVSKVSRRSQDHDRSVSPGSRSPSPAALAGISEDGAESELLLSLGREVAGVMLQQLYVEEHRELRQMVKSKVDSAKEAVRKCQNQRDRVGASKAAQAVRQLQVVCRELAAINVEPKQ
eukprot:TRINITY_DN46974_c0_g1_i1.p1 TRINITY_DN46974_c0_g1~~TRINITY_DN46974_c0_g1_i1.p1  ORF type:complete len:409 (-),score=104.83 TRINITY_DN46974_c0_g1_i1:41-1267(-)